MQVTSTVWGAESIPTRTSATNDKALRMMFPQRLVSLARPILKRSGDMDQSCFYCALNRWKRIEAIAIGL